MSDTTEDRIQEAVQKALEGKSNGWTLKELSAFLLNARSAITAITALAAAMGGWGWAKSMDTAAVTQAAADSAVMRVRREVDPIIDTLRRNTKATEAKVTRVDEKLDALIGVMQEAFPQFKRAAKARAQRNMDSREIRDALEGE